MSAFQNEYIKQSERLRQLVDEKLTLVQQDARQGREEMANSLNLFGVNQKEQVEGLGNLLKNQIETFTSQLGLQLSAFTQNNEQGLTKIGKILDERLISAQQDARQGRTEQAESLKNFGELLTGQLHQLTQRNTQSLETLRETVETKLSSIQVDNNQKLEQMRQTVDEKLHNTLEQRLGESFKQVSDRLEQVHNGLGEMRTLASGVGDLKKVLTNVKVRGTWGEVQLDTLLDQILSADQYAKNVSTRPNSSERVEFAIKLPGRDMTDDVVWLPIDAKFPLEDYQRLVEAHELADLVAMEEASKALEIRIKAEAKTIRDKYLEPPHTTDFGLLFLPIEGLYAEVIRRPGLSDFLQREYRVTVMVSSLSGSVVSYLRAVYTKILTPSTKEQLKELVEATPLWEPKPVTELSEIELAIKAKIEELNRKYATAMVRGKYVILEPDRMDPSLQCSSVEIIHPSSLTSKFAHDKITVGYKADNKPIVKNAVSVWLESPDRRNYEGIVFDPGVDHGSQYFNYWRGFSLKPKEGKIDLYLQHIHEVIADGDTAVYDHIIALMADAVQLRPRPGVALAIIGQQGVGKGVFVNNFGRLFGAHYLHISQNSHLIGKFNRHLAEGMIVFVDEAFWAGDKAAEGVLKALITEDRMMVEAKGVDAIQIKNHTRIFMASNNDWIVPAGLEERRFFVVKASEKYIGNQDYFGRLQQQMDRGGHAALLLYLQQFELDGINLSAFPRTEALASQKVLSMGLVEKFYYHLLKEGILFRSNGDFDLEKSQTPWGQGEVSTSIIYTAFLDYIKSDPRKWFSGPEGFGIEIKRLVPTIEKKRIKGQACYIFPSLKECRDSFDQRTKQDWGWPED
ncbi:DNA recombination protein RmuC [Methylomonas sp. 11b]|uniref:DNA recombination protein RmuC n=1 Tax=Methylomonas sp. 11b TaxID=1168169 RepID=UPI00047C50F9|nr:DNA recombination protein RmuC [Methylomonas sp. 11b]